MTEVKLLLEERRGAIDVITTWLPRIALAAVFLLVGSLKFRAHSPWVPIFNRIGVGDWFRYLTGVMQIAGALLLLVPPAAAIGFLLLGCTMLGAVAFWFIYGPAFSAIVPGALLAAIVGFGSAEVGRFLGNRRRGAVSN